MTEPIHELQTAVQKIKVGEFDIDIQYEGQDEIGDLARGLREASAQMQ